MDSWPEVSLPFGCTCRETREVLEYMQSQFSAWDATGRCFPHNPSTHSSQLSWCKHRLTGTQQHRPCNNFLIFLVLVSPRWTLEMIGDLCKVELIWWAKSKLSNCRFCMHPLPSLFTKHNHPLECPPVCQGCSHLSKTCQEGKKDGFWSTSHLVLSNSHWHCCSLRVLSHPDKFDLNSFIQLKKQRKPGWTYFQSPC